MGLKFKLPKESNHLYADFNEAYWSVDNICIYPEGNTSLCHFEFSAYASREAKKMNMMDIPTPSILIGSALSSKYNPLLYLATQDVNTEALFPNGVPNTIGEQKNIVYAYLKSQLNGIEFEDVFEEGQS